MGRKRMSKAVREGLKSILSLVEINLSVGSASEWVDMMTEKEYREAEAAYAWLWQVVEDSEKKA